MSNQNEGLTPMAFQAKIAAMQAEFQQQLAKVQASGDFASIAALSAKYQAEVMALTQQFQADMRKTTSAQVHGMALAMQNEPEQDDYDAVPKDDDCAHLMLLGAMYVEENNMLYHMAQPAPATDFRSNPKKTLTEFFSSLDMNIDAVDPDEIANLLANSWGVESKEALINMLAWLLKEGHNKELTQLIDYAQRRPDAAARSLVEFRECCDDPLAYEGFSDDDLQRKLVLAEHMQRKISSAGIWGWDVARYVHLLRLGYMAGYLNANDCWVHLRRLREPVVNRFADWAAFAHSYIQGYRWWSGTAGPIEDACHRLLNQPQSPWLFFGWFTPPSQLH